MLSVLSCGQCHSSYLKDQTFSQLCTAYSPIGNAYVSHCYFMAILGLLPQIKVQAVLMEDAASDSFAVSVLCTRGASEGLYVMTTKQ